jgi:hypothetical protein
LELRAGKDGAWLVSVTQADANPLFPDGNKNGLDDDFEAASEAWARGAYPTFEQWQRAQTLLPTDAIRYDVPLHLLERAEGRQP